jgi:hypothetical protein
MLVSQGKLKGLAKLYLAEHPELYAQAAASPIVQNLRHKHQ